MTVDVELMQNLSLTFFIASGALFIVVIVLFFLLDIKRVIGDVSGATAKKAIDNIRQQNAESGNKAYKPSPLNMERGKVTEKISPSGRLQKKQTVLEVAVGTSELDKTEIINTEAIAPAAEGTTVLNQTIGDAGGTTVLEQSAPAADIGATTVLNQVAAASDAGVNTVLSSSQASGFSVDYEIGFAGSCEMIL